MSSGINYDGLAALVAAGFSGIAAIITSLNRRTARTTEGKVEAVHSEVATSNGHTLGQLVEQNLPPTLDNSPAPSRVDDGTPSGGLPGQNETPAP